MKLKKEQAINSKLRLSRLYSLDLIRGIAAFLMVHGHFIYSTMSQSPKLWFTELFFFWAENFLYPPGWTTFFLIIGIGLVFSMVRQQSKNVPFIKRFLHVLKRLIIFVIIQYLYNIVSFGLFSIDHLLYYLNPIKSFSSSNLIAQIGLWSFVVFFILELQTILKQKIATCIQVGIAIFLAYFGYFLVHVQGNMVFYILVGGIFGSLLMKELNKGNYVKIVKFVLIAGIIFSIIGLLLHLETVKGREFVDNFINITILIKNPYQPIFSNYTNYADYLASPGFIFYSLGLNWILISTFFWIIDVKKRNYKIFRPLILWGNITLTLYVTHFILLNQMIFNLKLVYYFSFFTFMIWSLMMCVFIYIAAVFWSRFDFKYSLEWLIRKYS